MNQFLGLFLEFGTLRTDNCWNYRNRRVEGHLFWFAHDSFVFTDSLSWFYWIPMDSDLSVSRRLRADPIQAADTRKAKLPAEKPQFWMPNFPQTLWGTSWNLHVVDTFHIFPMSLNYLHATGLCTSNLLKIVRLCLADACLPLTASPPNSIYLPKLHDDTKRNLFCRWFSSDFLSLPCRVIPGGYPKTPENTDLTPNHYPYCMLLATCTMTRPFLMPSLQGMFLTPSRSLSSKLSETHCHGAASAQEMLLQHIANHLKHRTTMTTHSLALFSLFWPSMSERITTHEQGGTVIPSFRQFHLCSYTVLVICYKLITSYNVVHMVRKIGNSTRELRSRLDRLGSK